MSAFRLRHVDHMLSKGSPEGSGPAATTSWISGCWAFKAAAKTLYRSTYFAHIWASGYAAGYYAYMWSEMLDDDVYQWFVDHGGLTRANGQRFRDMILSRGDSEDYGPMFRAFYGRDPEVGPLLEFRGLTTGGT